MEGQPNHRKNETILHVSVDRTWLLSKDGRRATLPKAFAICIVVYAAKMGEYITEAFLKDG